MVAPSPSSAMTLAAAVTAGVLAYACLMNAMRTGDIATVTPFRYMRLLFSLGLGLASSASRSTCRCCSAAASSCCRGVDCLGVLPAGAN